MRGPIAFALSWPGPRLPLDLPRLDLPARGNLRFEAPDPVRFPAWELCYAALREGGTAPAVASGADEAAVAAFLEGRCTFPQIAQAIGEALARHRARPVSSVDDAVAASDEGRRLADAWLSGKGIRR